MFNILNLFKKKQENVMYEYIILNKDFENSECIICLENMIKGERVKILGCGHMYHYDCIMEWFKRKRECPLCSK